MWRWSFVIYSDIERSIALWIATKLQERVDAYFGTNVTASELLTREIPVYSENSFRTLLKYNFYLLLRQKDMELQTWGRLPCSNNELSAITSLMTSAMSAWIKQWRDFREKHPNIPVDDVDAKLSRVFPWIWMSEEVWTQTQQLVDSTVEDLQNKYRGFYIHPFILNADVRLIQAAYPAISLMSKASIAQEITDLVKDNLDSTVDPRFFATYVDYIVGVISGVGTTVIDDDKIKSNKKDIVKQKHQDFIEYLTLQVFSDRGYLYGSNRENINSAIKNGEQPSIDDLYSFLMARATTEAYNDLNLKSTKNDLYSRKELNDVISLNEQTIEDIAMSEYKNRLAAAGLLPDNSSTGYAFGVKIPTEEDILALDQELQDNVDSISDLVKNSPVREFTPDNMFDWWKNISQNGVKVAEERKIDKSFSDPLVQAATNDITRRNLQYLTTMAGYQPTYSKPSENPRISDFKRYYPNNYEETERISGFVRFYPDNYKETERVIEFYRYYPDNVIYTQRITDFKRYYPSNVVETARTNNYKRFYGGATDASQNNVGRTTDFTRYYPGVNDASQLLAGRTADFKRYYAYTAKENPRVDDFTRYNPFDDYKSYNTTSVNGVSEYVINENGKRSYVLKGKVASDFLPTYRTFSGHDMVVTVEVPLTRKTSVSKIIGAFQTISYSIHNEKAPVRVLGDMNVRRYVFGPRWIAGSIVLIVFDRHWMRELLDTYKAIKSETERYFLMDELPAMNITISCVNEYGHNAKLVLYGVTIVNEGQVMSINDIYTENTYQFYATGIDYLDRVEVGRSRKTSTVIDDIPYDKEETEAVPDEGENTTVLKDYESDEVAQEEIDPSSEEAAPSVYEAYDPVPDVWLDRYEDVIGEYNREDIPNSIAANKLEQIAEEEEKERNDAWLRDVYNPKLKAFLKLYNVSASNLKDDAALRKKLGNKYKQFKTGYNAFITAAENMKQAIKKDVNSKLNNYKEQLNIKVFDFENEAEVVPKSVPQGMLEGV